MTRLRFAFPVLPTRVRPGEMDANILNVGLDLAMAFGEHWLAPIQPRLAKHFPELSREDLDAYWVDDANLSHLFSQGRYYAWKDGALP